MSTIAVVGNPKPRSRTRAAAELVVEQLTGAPPDDVIDVIDLGPGLLGWGDGGVEQAVAALRAAELAVVASPTFKATYTGLLRLFLDHVGTGDLAGVTAVPLMLGAGPRHGPRAAAEAGPGRTRRHGSHPRPVPARPGMGAARAG